MREIYRSAQRTLIWLGDSVPSDEIAFRALQELWDTRHQEFVYNGEVFFSDGLTDIFKSFDTLLSRPWLWRTWVLQEVGVSAHAVVVCGEHFLSWDSFEAGILSAESSSEFREEDDVPFENFSRVEPIRYIRSSQFQDCQEPSISQMLRSGSKNESTDPRDLVYALLGLCETSTLVLPIVNYSLSVQEVYKETVVACLSSSHPFTILSLALDDGSSSLKLPSWVPDFSALPSKISGSYSYIGAGWFRAGRFLAGSKPHLEGKSQDVLSARENHRQYLETESSPRVL
jgi:Heterokaryon incompatibility protein (HET)